MKRPSQIISGMLVAAALLAGCATTPPPAPLPETAARLPELSTFTRLVDQAGLADTLRGTGPYTVFAPSDEAFKAVPAKTMAELAANKELLKSVLSYHVLPGSVTSDHVKSGPAKTLQGASATLGAAGTFMTVDEAVVQKADIVATNGVVQVVDRVLMPPKK